MLRRAGKSFGQVLTVISSYFFRWLLRPKRLSRGMLKFTQSGYHGRKLIRKSTWKYLYKCRRLAASRRLESNGSRDASPGSLKCKPYFVFFENLGICSRSNRPDMEAIFNVRTNVRFIHVQDSIWRDNLLGRYNETTFFAADVAKIYFAKTLSEKYIL